MRSSLYAAVMVFLLVGCAKTGTQATTSAEQAATLLGRPITNPPTSNATKSSVATASNRFALSLLRETQSQPSGENVVYSPVGVTTLLSLIASGAEGITKAQIVRTLGIEDLSDAELAEANRTVLARTDSESSLVNSNAIWIMSRVNIKPSFVRTAERDYEAEINRVDFSKERDVGRINEWISASTYKTIKSPVQLTPGTKMLLTSASLFLGKWAAPFAPSQTHNGPFTTSNGVEEPVRMMREGGQFNYFESTSLKVVELSYSGRRYSMFVFLPMRSTVDEFLQKVDYDELDSYIRSLERRQGRVELPTFKIQYNIDLIPALRTLGITRAFSPDADFDKIFVSRSFPIDLIKHDAYIDVNEYGTIASAVTVMGIGLAAPATREAPFVMTMDHPFLFLIMDNVAHRFVLLGIIRKPSR
mgnify:CR=1 FL=1